MVKLLVDGKEHKFTTTIFPDGTSQVWKLDLGLEEGDEIKILWLFENEAELFHVCQLAQLLEHEYDYSPDLVVPYLPYGRQDKEISNSASFALHTFTNILYNCNICRVETFDAHSNVKTETYIHSESPTNFHKTILNHDVICFPDKGAASRYGSYGLPAIYCEKVRDQLTGNILGLKVQGEVDLTNKRILIIDDICDGGMTFIKVAEALKPYQPKQIDLAVSHGLFSKGKQVLHDAGITNIYTTNSLLRNPEGFKVW
jgi:ribose-phosphate pyrophosphokinase